MPTRTKVKFSEEFKQSLLDRKQPVVKDYKSEAAELFHKLWGQAHDSPTYNKAEWSKMQLLLDKLGVPV